MIKKNNSNKNSKNILEKLMKQLKEKWKTSHQSKCIHMILGNSKSKINKISLTGISMVEKIKI